MKFLLISRYQDRSIIYRQISKACDVSFRTTPVTVRVLTKQERRIIDFARFFVWWIQLSLSKSTVFIIQWSHGIAICSTQNKGKTGAISHCVNIHDCIVLYVQQWRTCKIIHMTVGDCSKSMYSHPLLDKKKYTINPGIPDMLGYVCTSFHRPK